MIDAFKIAGCSRDTFNRWDERGFLQTSFAETTPGVRRDFSRENVFEMALLVALREVGISLEDAKDLIAHLLKHKPEVVAYNPRTNNTQYFKKMPLGGLPVILDELANNPGSAGWGDGIGLAEDFEPAESIGLIFPKAIADRVNKAFAQVGR